ncbi:MAG: PAS domain S-box protein [Vicinamibacterales bacterium]
MPQSQLPPSAAALAALAAVSADAIISTDRNLRITSWNPGAERLFGFTAAEAVGQSISIIAPPGEEFGQAHEAASRVFAGEQVDSAETVRRMRDGTLITIAYTLAPIRAGGEVVGIAALARPISERQRAERAARRLAAIVESSEDAIVSKDLGGIVTSWNAGAERMFGYSAEEMIGRSIRTIIPPDRHEEEDDVLARLRRGDKVHHFETTRRRKDGQLIDVSLSVSPIRDAAGAIVGASKVARDIGARKHAEAERARLLAESQEQARIMNTLNDVGRVVAATLDRQRVVQAVADAASVATGADAGAFDPSFRGEATIRVDDAGPGARLEVPIKGRLGNMIGGIILDHPVPGHFTPQHERVVEGIASWASVALENASLYVTAREANRLKDEFLATLSHELRTPLNAILGYARMVRAGLMVGEKQTRAVETIERNATALTRIVEDILDISRIISGKLRLRVQPVDLRAIVSAAIDAVMPAADAKRVRVERVLEAPDVPVAGDPDRLQQVIWNLLSNSVKYTPKGGKVQISLLRVNSHVEVLVSDTGIGISPGFLPHVFERFRQADASMTRERGGLGLGLSISKDLVELHGGTIEAASAGENHGATFRVKLPVMVVQAPSSPEPRVHPQAGGAPPMHVPQLHGVRVLAVDDEEDGRRLVREVLELTGAQVETAASGVEALELLAGSVPDVLLADLGMPRMDGFQLMHHVRNHADARVQQVPAAALTAYARSEDRTLALQHGFQLHLAKPIEPAELMAAVAALAKRATGRGQPQ